MLVNTCIAWSGQLITELVLRKVALRKLIKHDHGMGVVVNLWLWRQLVAIAEILLRATARTILLRIKSVLVLDTQIIDWCLSCELGLSLLFHPSCTFAP